MSIQNKMHDRLNPAYTLDERTRVWSRPNYESISYSDGDAIELRLLEIVTQSEDLSVLSDELKQHCTDWPSLYHLGSARANVLRPFESLLKKKNVLEIGAGCGAITRCLGEWGANVTAVEGSHRRACIARARARDLNNVNVIAETFSDFESAHQFDVITLIGVLEYANLFVEGAQADRDMLAKVRHLLKDDGLLIIAIENQLGLKYFAGYPEDHKGVVGYGIEDRYRSKEVKTYGRVALQQLLRTCDFKEHKFFAAFPDYKLPSAIISDEGLQIEAFDSASLAVGTARQDPQMPSALAFDPERTWPLLCKNQIAMDLANSFVVLAGNAVSVGLEQTDEFAWHFNTSRQARFTKGTTFAKDREGQLEIRRSKLQAGSELITSDEHLSNVIVPHERYVEGTLLHSDFVEVLAHDGWDDKELRRVFLDYINALQSSLEFQLGEINISHTEIPGRFIDAIPQNIVRKADGSWGVFDQEWAWDQPISLSYLCFRSMLSVLGSISRVGRHREVQFSSRLELITHALNVCGSEASPEEIDQHCQLETQLQALSRGVSLNDDHVKRLLIQWPSDPGNVWGQVHSLQTQLQAADGHLHSAEHNIRVLNETIQSTKEALATTNDLALQLETQLNRQSAVIQDREQFIRMVVDSRSWQLTKPIRYLSRKVSAVRATAPAVPIKRKSSLSLRLDHWRHRPTSVCLCIHAFHPELLSDISTRLSSIPVPVRALVTTSPDKYQEVLTIARSWPFPAEVLSLENRGRDILPFLLSLKQVRSNELILKVHTKKSSHRGDGDVWRNELINKLLEPTATREIFEAFRKDYRLGMIVPDGHVLSVDEFMGHNRMQYDALCNRLMPKQSHVLHPIFAGGAMFFARKQALEPLLQLAHDPAAFEPEQGQLDGTLAHAVERILGVTVQALDYRISSTEDLINPAVSRASKLHTDPLLLR